jgi:hypothetical protein
MDEALSEKIKAAEEQEGSNSQSKKDEDEIKEKQDELIKEEEIQN